jgi:hypothetical protein
MEERFYFKILGDKCIINKKRGYNIYVSVHSLNEATGFFRYLGEDWANSASYKGTKAMAAQIVADKFNY